jgi:aminoglycoside phosphotransferase (APT) family kinase protein
VDRSQRGAMYEEMVRLLAALHTLDLDRHGLRDYGKPGNYFSRQVTRWSDQYRASQTRQQPAMEQLMAWLNANIPADDGRTALIHGDFRFDNVIFHPTEPRVLAVLDWELSTLGHPWSDIAYQCMQLRLPEDFIIPGLGGVDRAALGIPSEEEYVARYCALTGIDHIPLWSFCVVFSFFRLAAILEGVYKRSLDGTASSPKAAQYGAVVEPMAELALKEL